MATRKRSRRKPASKCPSVYTLASLVSATLVIGSALAYCAIYPPPQFGVPKKVEPARVAPVVQRVAKTDISRIEPERRPEPLKVAPPPKAAPPKPSVKAVQVKALETSKPVPPLDSVVKLRTNIGHGSAVHIGNGKFLTANHVVDGAIEFHVRAMDESERDAEVLWTSAAYDVALIQIKTDRDKFKVTDIACRQPRIWEEIFALGNPQAIEFVQTRGVVIGMPRAQSDWASVMVVDIPMYPGMSGGPVVDKQGRLIGLTVGGYRSPPMNLAVPTVTICNLMGL